eukprot:TRINITY_DN49049_c0_g1_i1.p1 TRINITY_DN49049_c0_g1~~TRINITY_DN49049_c0_g1_i1.p1  ORF type:complete len:655 (-),score=70.26 TRINITY_DN49049_c0_g1_i1:182-1990(-)
MLRSLVGSEMCIRDSNNYTNSNAAPKSPNDSGVIREVYGVGVQQSYPNMGQIREEPSMFFMPQNSLDASGFGGGPLDEDGSTNSPRALASTAVVNNGGQHHPFAHVTTTTGLTRSISGGAASSFSSEFGPETGNFRSVINPLQVSSQEQHQPNQVGRGGRIAITVPDSEMGGTGAASLEPPPLLKHTDSKVSFVHRKQQLKDGGGGGPSFIVDPQPSSHRVAKPTMAASMNKSTRSAIHATTTSKQERENMSVVAANSPFAHRCFRYGNVFLQRWISPDEVSVARALQLCTKAMMESRTPSLYFPLISMHTYRGVVVTAHALIPFGKAYKRVYRTDLAPDMLISSNEFGVRKGEVDPGVPASLVHQFVRRLAESVNLLPVDVGQKQLKVAGVEVVEGPDTRLYVTNPMGLLPPLFADDPACSPKRRLEHVVVSRAPHPYMWCPSHRVEQSCYFIVQLLPKLAKNIIFAQDAILQATAAHNEMKEGGGSSAQGGRARKPVNHLKHYIGPVGIFNLMQDQLVQLLHSFGLNICLMGSVLLVLLQERNYCRLKVKAEEEEAQKAPASTLDGTGKSIPKLPTKASMSEHNKAPTEGASPDLSLIHI